ncbi:MAG: NFACT family protein [Firmicutes bacterium]|nr:NFACT family protein [Bacillota bacterium]
MAFDSFVLAAVLHEIRPVALRSRIGKIHQPDKSTVILKFHGLEGGGKLLLSAHPEQGRMQITESVRENPMKAPLFAMVLRKWLEGAKILALEQTPGERVAQIQLETRNDIGDITLCRLIVEIMGKHSNIILVNEDGMIVDGIRRYGSNLSRYRQVLPGQPYIPPPPMHKLTLKDADEDRLAQALFRRPELPLKEALVKNVCGVSPLFAVSCCCAHNIDENCLCEELGIYEISKLCQALTDLREKTSTGAFQPVLLYRQGQPVDFAAFLPSQWQTEEYRSFSGMSQAMDAFYGYKEQQALFQEQKRALNKTFSHHIARLDKKISLQEQDLRQCEAADRYKEAGDLLSAYQYHLRKGMESAELPSFADENATVTIALNPALSPQENIGYYYRRYSKAKNARTPIERHLQANREELDYVFSLQTMVNCAEKSSDLQAIAKEAASEGLIRPPAPAGKGDKKHTKEKEPALPPRQYTSPDGYTILAGRNNKQNDKLTLKMAAEKDIWLHAQKIPGCHVIIESRGGEVPDATLRMAAEIAAWFSDGREADKIAVDYTLAREVKKPAHAKPGMVIYFKQKTLYVQPKEPGK